MKQHLSTSKLELAPYEVQDNIMTIEAHFERFFTILLLVTKLLMLKQFLSVSGKMIISVKYLLGIVSCVVVYGIKSIVLMIASYLSTISTTGRSYRPKMLHSAKLFSAIWNFRFCGKFYGYCIITHSFVRIDCV